MSPNLKNTYFALRHGHSQANEASIILSDPKSGTRDYGLTDLGKTQVKNSITASQASQTLDQNTIIISSDFLRAAETAQITKEILHTKEITFTPALRERFFGNLEKQPNDNYEKVWKEDETKSKTSTFHAEDVQDVLQRTTDLITDLEQKYTNQNILIVSHGDTLQILQTYFTDTEPYFHRHMPHLSTAELRKLN